MSSSWKTCFAEVLNVLPRIGHFDNESDLADLADLEAWKARKTQHQASEDRFVFPYGHGETVLLKAYKDEVYTFAEGTR